MAELAWTSFDKLLIYNPSEQGLKPTFNQSIKNKQKLLIYNPSEQGLKRR